jgi:hypothetical protein
MKGQLRHISFLILPCFFLSNLSHGIGMSGVAVANAMVAAQAVEADKAKKEAKDKRLAADKDPKNEDKKKEAEEAEKKSAIKNSNLEQTKNAMKPVNEQAAKAGAKETPPPSKQMAEPKIDNPEVADVPDAPQAEAAAEGPKPQDTSISKGESQPAPSESSSSDKAAPADSAPKNETQNTAQESSQSSEAPKAPSESSQAPAEQASGQSPAESSAKAPEAQQAESAKPESLLDQAKGIYEDTRHEVAKAAFDEAGGKGTGNDMANVMKEELTKYNGDLRAMEADAMKRGAGVSREGALSDPAGTRAQIEKYHTDQLVRQEASKLARAEVRQKYPVSPQTKTVQRLTKQYEAQVRNNLSAADKTYINKLTDYHLQGLQTKVTSGVPTKAQVTDAMIAGGTHLKTGRFPVP